MVFPYGYLIYPVKQFNFDDFYNLQFGDWIVSTFDWWDDSGNWVTVRSPVAYDMSVHQRTVNACNQNTGDYLAEIKERQHDVMHRRWHQLNFTNSVAVSGNGNGVVTLPDGAYATRGLITLANYLPTPAALQGNNPPKLGGIGFCTFNQAYIGDEALQPIETTPGVYYPNGYGNNSFKIFCDDHITWTIEIHGVTVPLLKASDTIHPTDEWNFPNYEV